MSLAIAEGQAVEEAPVSLESLLATKVVTASRFAQNVADAPGAMTVVSREEIERFGGLTLREILGRVAGLDWTTDTFTDRSIISVRGDQAEVTGSHVLFLINGRPTRAVLEGGINSEFLEAFPIGIIERIEVIEGPGSVLYGSNAFAGVINLITRKQNGKAGSLRGFGGGNTGAASGGSAEGFYRRGDFHLAGAAQFHSSNQGTTTVWPRSSIMVPGYTIYDNSRGVFAEAGYKGFSAMVASMEWRAPFVLDELPGENRWRRTFADLGYDFKPAKHWDSGLHTTYTWTGLTTIGFPNISRSSGEVEVDWTNSVALNERNRITFGTIFSYQYGVELLHAPAQTFPVTDASRPGGGFYAQLEHQLTDTLTLIGGFQSNLIQNIPLRTVPRAGAVFHPATHWHVKGLFSQAFRAPSLNETQIRNPYVIGDWNLLPEIATTFEAALLYQRNGVQMNFNYFHTRQSNIIGLISVTPDVLQYRNVGGLVFQGLQWEAKAYIRPEWLVVGSLLYQTNRDEGANLPRQPIPPLGVKAGVSYAEKRGWTASIFDVYSALVPGYAGLPNPKPVAHHLVSAHLRLSLEKYFGPAASRVAAFAHADNLVNHAIWQPAYAPTELSTLPIQRGRTIYYGLEFRFKRE